MQVLNFMRFLELQVLNIPLIIINSSLPIDLLGKRVYNLRVPRVAYIEGHL